MSLHKMAHEIDPKEELKGKIGSLDGIAISGAQVLIATYKRPEKTAGGVFITQNTQEEDEYQGKVGLVLMKGPLAFMNDSDTDFAGFNAQVGDWVFYKTHDGFAMKVNGNHCRLLQDVHVRGRIERPDLVL